MLGEFHFLNLVWWWFHALTCLIQSNQKVTFQLFNKTLLKCFQTSSSLFKDVCQVLWGIQVPILTCSPEQQQDALNNSVCRTFNITEKRPVPTMSNFAPSTEDRHPVSMWVNKHLSDISLLLSPQGLPQAEGQIHSRIFGIEWVKYSGLSVGWEINLSALVFGSRGEVIVEVSWTAAGFLCFF